MLEGVLGIAAGIYFVAVSRWAARLAVRSWAQVYPNRGVSEMAYRLAFRIGGSIVIVFGLLSLLGVLPSRR